MKNKKTKYILISIILSLLIHIIIISIFEHIRLRPNNISQPLELNRSKVITFTETNIINAKELEKLNKETLILPKKQKNKLLKTETKIKIKPVLLSNNKLTGDFTPTIQPPKELDKTAFQKTALLPKIIQFDGDKLSKAELKYNHLIIPKKIRKDYSPSLIFDNKPSKTTQLIKSSSPQIKTIPLELKISPPKVSLTKTPQLKRETKLIAFEEATPIDPYLIINLYKFPEPDGSGYFKVNITTNKESANFKKFNKDIIFLIDISGSIVNKQLSEFIKGITESLPNLSIQDQFEIVAFKSKPLSLFGKMTHPTKDNIAKATDFLNNLEQSGSTNLYGALAPYVDGHYDASKRPLLIFMLSDGNLNSGEIASSRNFINNISNRNHQTASIYTFANAKDSNTFLLDLLAYRNRGNFTNTNTPNNSSKQLKKDIDSTGSIILKGLNYQISSKLASKTFPKKLPNLYLDRTIALYGKYSRNTNKVSLRITGTDKNNNTHELIYSEYLDNALNADRTLPKQWAQQYIFHLYSLLTAHYSEKTKQKIYDLAKQYSIPIKYINKYLTKEE